MDFIDVNSVKTDYEIPTKSTKSTNDTNRKPIGDLVTVSPMNIIGYYTIDWNDEAIEKFPFLQEYESDYFCDGGY